jgi:hypothetical protein
MSAQRFAGQKVFHVIIVKNLKPSVYDGDIVFKFIGMHLYLPSHLFPQGIRAIGLHFLHRCKSPTLLKSEDRREYPGSGM